MDAGGATAYHGHSFVIHVKRGVSMSSRIARRPFIASAIFTLLFSLGSAAQAEWPEKPIRFIVNAAAGGAADGTARVLADGLSKRLGQPIIIDNKPGASGVEQRVFADGLWQLLGELRRVREGRDDARTAVSAGGRCG